MSRNVHRCSLLLAAVFVVSGMSGAKAQESSTAGDSSLVLTIEVTNRNYPGWREEWQVRLGETFYLGDSKFTARAERFVSDFRINERGEVLNYSDELKNPAAQVVVYGDSAATDTTWAFMNFPPHFSPRSFFAFKLLSIERFEPPTGSSDAGKALPGSTPAAQRKEEDDG